MTIDSAVASAVSPPQTKADPPANTIHRYRFVQRLLILYAFVLPYELVLELAGVPLPTILKLYRIVGFAIVFLWILKAALSRRQRRLDIFDYGFLFILIAGALAALLWKILDGQGQLETALSDSLLMGFAFLVYLITKQEMGEPKQARTMLSAFVVGTVSSILISGTLLWRFSSGPRFEGFYDNPNSLALAAGVSMLVVVGRLLFDDTTRSPGTSIKYGFVLVLLAVVMLFSGSRGMIVALLVSLIALNIPARKLRGTRDRRQQRAIRVLTFACVLVLALLSVAAAASRYGETISLHRLTNPTQSSSGNRIDLVESSYLVARDHYFLGVGTAQYRFYHRDAFARLGNPNAPLLGRFDVGTHNAYMNVLTSNGILALAIYVLMLVGLYRALRRRVRSSDEYRSLIATYIPLLIFIIVAGMSSVLFLGPDYWLCMAILTAGARGYLRGPSLKYG